MTTQISTIEFNPELTNLAYEMGLNVPKTCKNALKDAIRRLQDSNSGFATVNVISKNDINHRLFIIKG